MNILIEKMDHEGNGIGYLDGVVTFVPKTIPGDVCEIKIVKSKKKYNKASLIKIITPSKDRIEAKCPYYSLCGGCHLQNFPYKSTLDYKLDMVKNIFKRINIDIKPIVIENPSPFNYRNKIELKVVNKKVGFYQENTHQLVEISNCLITQNCINKIIPLISTWNITNGEVTLRCNQNEELLIIINTQDKLNIDIDSIKKDNKLVGIILNNKTIHGESHLFKRINNILYMISHDSFFQVNSLVASTLFNLVSDNLNDSEKVLDLYSGVGTLSLTAAKKAKEVVGIEIVPNAVLNSIKNAQINKLDNVKFVLNDVELAIEKINTNFDTWLLDPPRSGIDKVTINVIKKELPKKIIYVSCNPHSLVRDINELKEFYNIKNSYICDLFSYTHHIETVCILEKSK